jgi:hypothetical protein
MSVRRLGLDDNSALRSPTSAPVDSTVNQGLLVETPGG